MLQIGKKATRNVKKKKKSFINVTGDLELDENYGIEN